jgi:hypothetical protein
MTWEISMKWTRVPGSEMQILHNGQGELFIRDLFKTTEIRISECHGGLRITDFGGKGKFRIREGVEVGT